MMPPQILSSPSGDSVRSTMTSWGLPLWWTFIASCQTSDSPQPPPIVPQNVPSARTAIFAPGRRGVEPREAATVATTSGLPDLSAWSISLKTSSCIAVKSIPPDHMGCQPLSADMTDSEAVRRPSRAGLARLVETVVPGASLLRCTRLKGGMSGGAFAVSYRQANGGMGRLVVRIAEDWRGGPHDNAKREARTLSVLSDAGVPVPELLLADLEGTCLGAPL